MFALLGTGWNRMSCIFEYSIHYAFVRVIAQTITSVDKTALRHAQCIFSVHHLVIGFVCVLVYTNSAPVGAILSKSTEQRGFAISNGSFGIINL